MMGLLTCLPILAIWEFRQFGQTGIACAWRQTRRCMSISSRRLKRIARGHDREYTKIWRPTSFICALNFSYTIENIFVARPLTDIKGFH
ncbi:hypothetical protein O6H91_Y156300 [Diphasiastrum complanatum]|nr:hypothetical protein O6H91_Y156300 [Diphasiastrum complanatum]